MSRPPDPREWRVECMNDAGEIRAKLYDGWEQNAANEHALHTLRAETGDPSWRTVCVVRDDMEAAR